MSSDSKNRTFQQIIFFHQHSTTSDLLRWLSFAVNDDERCEVLSEVNSQFIKVAREEKWEKAFIFSLRGFEMDNIRTRIWKKTIAVN